jgi:class 3 adenylate cyclase
MEDNTETLTVMFIDIVDYTNTTLQLSREELHRVHDAFDEIALNMFSKYNGRVIKKMGDAYLIAFKSPTNAVICGMELQNAFYDYNKKSETPLRIRVSIHTGEVINRHNDIYGEAVNVASRMQKVTPADQVFFSEAVFSAMNKQEIPFAHLGLKRFRGLKYPVRIFRAKNIYAERKKRSFAILSKIIKTILIIGLIGIVGLAVYFTYLILTTNHIF